MEYMSREDYCEISCGKENREGYKTCHNCSMTDVPAADVQPVDEITKIIQARLNGVQKVKIDAMLSGDSTTAYKMVGAETVCIAILQDLEAIKG